MPVYERVQDGEVVERVQPLAGDYEDTRLGLLSLEGQQGWRIAGQLRAAAESSSVDLAKQPTPTDGADQPTNSDKGK